jgi:hypothetical protein
MDKITPDMIMTSLIVAAALIGFVLLVWSLIDKIRSARKPAADLVRWQQETNAKLDNDNKRLNTLENGQKVMLRGINALISHEINGNSADKLNKSQNEIMEYLIER